MKTRFRLYYLAIYDYLPKKIHSDQCKTIVEEYGTYEAYGLFYFKSIAVQLV